MLDMRCWHYTDAGRGWIIQCKHCAAGWLPAKGDYHPRALIEHSAHHQRRPSRIEELRFQIIAVAHSVALVDRDLIASPGAGELWLEREHLTIWDRMLVAELAELVHSS
jgi:hypothetical protein